MPRDEYVAYLERQLAAHRKVARQQTAMIGRLVAEVARLRARFSQASAVGDILRQAGADPAGPAAPAAGRHRRDRHGLHIVRGVAVAGAAARLLRRHLAIGAAAAAVLTGSAIMLPPPGSWHFLPGHGHPAPASASVPAGTPLPGSRHARRPPRQPPPLLPAALPPRLSVSASAGPVSARARARAGLADGRSGRDARAILDLTGPQNHWRKIDVDLPHALPPLPVAEPVARISGCVIVDRIFRPSRRLLQACGHISVTPSGTDIGPGTSSNP